MKRNSDSKKTISESSLYALDDDHQIELDDQLLRVQIEQKETSHFLQKNPELKIKQRNAVVIKDAEV